jgi:C4-dicarboxylate-specific signal transduction histidine kinase
LKDVVQQDVFNKNACLEMLESIEKTTARISRITSGLRAFAHNVRDSEFTRASLKEMVNDTLLLYGKHLRDRDIRAELGDIPVTLEIECRPPEISQVLVNLLDNACDAIALLSEKWIKIQASDLGDSIEIAITDAGHGVRESIRKNIFDPFFTTKDIGQGPGLGLSISKGIIGGHNGTIRLDEKNAHTCFVIQLPKIQSAAKKREKISA